LWSLTNRQGTVRDIVDSDGIVVNHRNYDSFGNLTSETNAAVDFLFGYTGRAFDESTGLQNNLNRWYDFPWQTRSVPMRRRTFLNRASLLAFSPTVPTFLSQSIRAAEIASSDRILVVVQLSGGNDGINTVVPTADEGYAKHRRELRLPKKEMIKVSDTVSLHPSLRGFADLLDDDRLSIV
jgi:hypothetical protein